MDFCGPFFRYRESKGEERLENYVPASDADTYRVKIDYQKQMQCLLINSRGKSPLMPLPALADFRLRCLVPVLGKVKNFARENHEWVHLPQKLR